MTTAANETEKASQYQGENPRNLCEEDGISPNKKMEKSTLGIIDEKLPTPEKLGHIEQSNAPQDTGKILNYKDALCNREKTRSDEDNSNHQDFDAVGKVAEVFKGNEIPLLNFPNFIHDYWKSTLIIRMTGKLLDLPFLKEQLLRIWKIKKTPELHHLGLGFYAIHNLLDEDRVKIFTSQWKIGPNPILTCSWTPNFKLAAALKQLITTLWVNLPMLPIEYQSPQTLITIGNLLRKTRALDVSKVNTLHRLNSKDLRRT